MQENGSGEWVGLYLAFASYAGVHASIRVMPEWRQLLLLRGMASLPGGRDVGGQGPGEKGGVFKADASKWSASQVSLHPAFLKNCVCEVFLCSPLSDCRLCVTAELSV